MPCASSERLGFGFVFRNPTADMTKPDMQKAHWKPCSSMMACCTGWSDPPALARPSMVNTFLPRTVCESVDQDCAGAALGAIAAKLGAGQAELVPKRPRQCLLLHGVDAALLSVDVESDEPLGNAGGLTQCGGGSEEIARGGNCRAASDDSLDQASSGDRVGRASRLAESLAFPAVARGRVGVRWLHVRAVCHSGCLQPTFPQRQASLGPDKAPIAPVLARSALLAGARASRPRCLGSDMVSMD